MTNAYTRQFKFQYDYMVMARVTGVYTLVDERKLLIDASALDSRAVWQKVPVGTVAGVARNYRVGQIVGLLFRHSSAMLPIAVANLFNLETDPRYTDPLPPPFEYLDDQVYFHPETKAFLRFRSATSTAAKGGGDGAPAIAEITLASGATLVLEETDATHAKATLALPSGASIVIAPDGTITATSPKKAVVAAPDVELGADNAAATANRVVRYADLKAVVDFLNAHTHGGVQSGAATSGTVPSALTAPTCSTSVFSE